MNKKLITFILFFIFPMLLISGFSSWVILGEKSENVGSTSTSTYVCYINSDETGKQYTRIEKALEVANSIASESSKQVVYVRPGTNPTIYKDCTIGNYVTLCIPYADTTYYLATNSSATNFNWGSGQVFSDNNPTQYRKNLVTVKENVDINILTNGSLQIGGVFGNPEVGITGIVNGDYCQVTLEKNAKIISNGNVECYGFIKESDLNNNSIFEIKSGTLKMPFMIYDFKGGTLTLSSHNENVCPFSIYDLANIQSVLRIHSGSLIQAEYRIEINDEPFSGTVNLIGDANTKNTALRLTKGYIDIKYGTFTPNGTPLTVIEGQTLFNLYGNLSISSIIMSVKYLIANVDMNTANYFFPIPYKFKFIVEENSIFTASEKVKMMPGSSVYIKENAKMNINKEVIFYPEEYSETRAAAAASNYPSNLSAAKITNNGTIIINTSGSLGIAGSTNVINVDKVDAVIEVYNTSSTTSNDEVEGENLGTKHSHKQEITGSPIANVTTNYISTSRETLGGYIYESVKLSDGSIVWKKVDIPSTPINITYYSVYDDGTNEIFSNHGNKTTALATETLTLNTPSKSGYIFKGWFLDSECTKLINNGQLSGLAMYKNSINGEINIYACWEKGKVVNIKYVDSNGNSLSGTNYNYQVSPGSTIKLADDPEIITSSDTSNAPDYKIKYTLVNWIIDGENYDIGQTYEVPLDLEDGETLEIRANSSSKKYYKLSVSGKYESITFTSIDGSTYSSAGNYYVEENSTVEVSIKHSALVGQTVCKKNGSKWLTSYSKYVPASGSFEMTGVTTLTV